MTIRKPINIWIKFYLSKQWDAKFSILQSISLVKVERRNVLSHTTQDSPLFGCMGTGTDGCSRVHHQLQKDCVTKTSHSCTLGCHCLAVKPTHLKHKHMLNTVPRFLFLTFSMPWVQIALSTSRVRKTLCPLVRDKLFCLWDKCEFVLTCSLDK